jgi:hypothetical protein
MTQSGFLVGTPGYMAPEQAGGKRALIGPATDIYALGVMLYQLITGQLPFQHESTLELLRAVTSDEPTRPRRLQPRLPRDLEAITLHCLEKEPNRRYPSALALAEDLRRFREGKHVVARPVGKAARLARACRRRPVVALLVALLTVSLLAGMGGITWKWLEANAHARRADVEKQAALYQAYRASVAAASAALQNHDVADAARHLKLAPPALQGWEWRHLHNRLDDSSAVVRLPAGGNGLAITEGGLLIASPHQLRVGVFTSAGLRITDLDGGEHGTVPIGPERRHHVNVAHTRRGFVHRLLASGAAILASGGASCFLTRLPESDWRFAVATATTSSFAASARTALGSPRAVRIGRRACGTWPPARCWPPAGDTRARSLLPRSAGTARAW